MARRLMALAALALACGPSLTTVHEGTIRFEHCNRLDLEQEVAKNDCQHCWQKWLTEYTYGQPRDRIDYARKRVRQLSNGHDTRPVLNVEADEEHPKQQRQFYLVVPGPTSLRAPPPPIATVVQTGAPDAGSLAKTSPEPPAENCAEACRATWQKCSGKSCGADYSSCMKHCFE